MRNLALDKKSLVFLDNYFPVAEKNFRLALGNDKEMVVAVRVRLCWTAAIEVDIGNRSVCYASHLAKKPFSPEVYVIGRCYKIVHKFYLNLLFSILLKSRSKHQNTVLSATSKTIETRVGNSVCATASRTAKQSATPKSSFAVLSISSAF